MIFDDELCHTGRTLDTCLYSSCALSRGDLWNRRRDVYDLLFLRRTSAPRVRWGFAIHEECSKTHGACVV
ncbi:hypothetical protein EVAR_21968_1 [Eumeta japonica]|uniref:Uncharacterized protein n=1 Tax=Eumeta variegata TaxID=151549 RepID=A0A4C1VVB3_EUMVA|nr:hypothetical protein EVAR_21968_1 [Eumeta japonica]